ncbi:MAG: transposase [Bacteroidetes bacterium]|nr:transposase [Bacteroidota bacterium]
MFAEDETCRNYRYSTYVTNLEFAPAEVWRMYRGRGDAENRIKELKQDFGFDSFNLNGFYPTEAALTFAMIAYNLMSLFRTFAIGAYFEKQNGKLDLNKKRRKWFSCLWNYPLKIPFHFSNP